MIGPYVRVRYNILHLVNIASKLSYKVCDLNSTSTEFVQYIKFSHELRDLWHINWYTQLHGHTGIIEEMSSTISFN